MPNAHEQATARPRAKRPLRGKTCGWCDTKLESCAKGYCGRIYPSADDTAPKADSCFWVRTIRELGPHGALALSKQRQRNRALAPHA